MAYRGRKPKPKSICAYCGREIKWIRPKGSQRSFPVEPRNICFLPDESGREFLTPDGIIRRGREATDGLLGYLAHDCIEKQLACARPELTENEILRRQWS